MADSALPSGPETGDFAPLAGPVETCRPGACPVISEVGPPDRPGCPCYPLRETVLRREAPVALGAVVRLRSGGHCMTVLGFPAGGSLLLCGWLEHGRVRAEVFSPAQLELVPAFGPDEAQWLEAFRNHGTMLHQLRQRQRPKAGAQPAAPDATADPAATGKPA